MVGDDNVCILQLVSGMKEAALTNIGAAPTTALTVICGHAKPDLLADTIGPVVPVAVPLPSTQSIEHSVVSGQGLCQERRTKPVGVQRYQG